MGSSDTVLGFRVWGFGLGFRDHCSTKWVCDCKCESELLTPLDYGASLD